MSLWESFTCWYLGRQKTDDGIKLPPSSNEEPNLNIKNLICSYCYKYMNDENEYVKKAIIKNHLFGFCHDDCYNDWLKHPHNRFLGKIN